MLLLTTTNIPQNEQDPIAPLFIIAIYVSIVLIAYYIGKMHGHNTAMLQIDRLCDIIERMIEKNEDKNTTGEETHEDA